MTATMIQPIQPKKKPSQSPSTPRPFELPIAAPTPPPTTHQRIRARMIAPVIGSDANYASCPGGSSGQNDLVTNRPTRRSSRDIDRAFGHLLFEVQTAIRAGRSAQYGLTSDWWVEVLESFLIHVRILVGFLGGR